MAFKRLGKLVRNYLVGAVLSSTLVSSQLHAQSSSPAPAGSGADLITAPENVSPLKAREKTSPESRFMRDVSAELDDRFESYSLKFQRLHERLGYNHHDLRIDEEVGDDVRRRVEKSFTRAFTEMLERTPLGERLRTWVDEKEWRSLLYDTTKDTIIDDYKQEMGAVVVPGTVEESAEDHTVKYDLDKPVVRKPEWKRNINFAVKPFSMHPYVSARWKADGTRLEMRIYHDRLRLATYVPVTSGVSLYTSTSMKNFDAQEVSFNMGLQHNLKFPCSQTGSGLLQYGFSINNSKFLDGKSIEREYRPRAFLAFVYEF